MTDLPDVPPEGKLIKEALRVSGITQREAARRAGISDTRWRQIVAGYQAIGGRKVEFRSPDETLARMARVVDVSPEQLEAAGREGAAVALRAIHARQKDANARSLPSDAQARVDERWLMLEAVLRQAPVGLSPAEHTTLLGRISVFFEQSPEWQQPSGLPSRTARPE